MATNQLVLNYSVFCGWANRAPDDSSRAAQPDSGLCIKLNLVYIQSDCGDERRIGHAPGRPRKANQLPQKRRSADRQGFDGFWRAAAYHAEWRSEARRSGRAKL